ALAVRFPTTYNDTASYETLMRMLLSRDFRGYDGSRTPAYPLLMIACEDDARVLFVVHMLMGIATAVILYRAFLLFSGSRGLALAVGMSHHLNLSALLYEATLLTETSTTLLCALCLWLVFRLTATWRAGRAPQVAQGFAIGVLAALATLDRPLCVLL